MPKALSRTPNPQERELRDASVSQTMPIAVGYGNIVFKRGWTSIDVKS